LVQRIKEMRNTMVPWAGRQKIIVKTIDVYARGIEIRIIGGIERAPDQMIKPGELTFKKAR